MEFQAGRVNKTGEPKLASGLVFDKQQSPALSCLALKLGFLERNVVKIRSAKRNEFRINTSCVVPLFIVISSALVSFLNRVTSPE